MSAPGNFAADGGDPRLSDAGLGQMNLMRPQMRKLHDPTVSFEEYLYYASLTRAAEDADVGSIDTGERTGILATIFPSKAGKGNMVNNGRALSQGSDPEKRDTNTSKRANRMSISDDEWINASRAMRTATWSSVFYLITTDILGPFGVP